jgi:hypothetical protein
MKMLKTPLSLALSSLLVAGVALAQTNSTPAPAAGAASTPAVGTAKVKKHHHHNKKAATPAASTNSAPATPASK